MTCESCHCGHGNNALMVAEFHRAFGAPVRTTPTIDVPEVSLRAALIEEELGELHDAVEAGDVVGVADALGDLAYVIHGAALTFGIDLDAVFAEIHSANMRKLGPDGQPILDANGKVSKPEGWSPPDIARILRIGTLTYCSATWGGGEKCTREPFALGLCGAHYQQQDRGVPFKQIRFYRPPGLSGRELATWCVERAVDIDSDGHYIWQFAARNQYPVVRYEGETIGAHRLVAEHLVAFRPLTSADVVHHRCANRRCIRPEHLQVTTAQANTAEMRDRNALLKRISSLEEEIALLRNQIASSVDVIDDDGLPEQCP